MTVEFLSLLPFSRLNLQSGMATPTKNEPVSVLRELPDQYCEGDKGMPRGRSGNWEHMARRKGLDSGTREVESSLYDSLGV